MAYVQNQDEEENQSSQQNPLASTQAQGTPASSSNNQDNSAQTITSGETSQTASAPSSQPKTTSSSQKSSGRFTNLQNFINANKNFNKAGGGLAGSLETKIGAQRQDADNKLAQEQQGFDTSYGAETKRIQDTTDQARQGTRALGATGANAPSVDLNDAQGKITAGTQLAYTGPTDYNDTTGLQTAADKLTGVKEATNSESGRFGLLNQYFNKPSYSYGQQKLDQLILQADPNQASKLQAAGQNAAQFNDTYKAAQANLQNQVAAGKTLADTNRGAITGEAKTAGESLLDDLGRQAGTYNTNATTAANIISPKDAIDALKSSGYQVTNSRGDLRRATVNIGGLDIPVNLLMDQIQAATPMQATLNNISPDELRRYNALAGVQGLGLTTQATGPTLNTTINNGISNTLKNSAQTLASGLSSAGLDKGNVYNTQPGFWDTDVLSGLNSDPYNSTTPTYNPDTYQMQQYNLLKRFWDSLKGQR